MSSGGRPTANAWQRQARIKRCASGLLPDAGVRSASGFFSYERVLCGKDIVCPAPLKHGVAIGSFGQPAIPRRVRIDSLEKAVITSIQFYREMGRGAFHADTIVAALEARQFIAGM